ncbi:Histidine biosynthesis bifunctional protein hisIE [Includes: Phosphoribosyl-AMP cyclohydrolase (PRA-CH); Phosphoribosyl-ATP pyrophosphatase (PRA-PH)] [Limnospira indica PCC 8005]|uniref:Phosphoribosyl-ATP pyrophosphatase n=3 Tax=Limnospira TaxID=2596745 RepID=A0A9P1NYI5_9CYAN|nr:Histidine biosynthesis bifunctional protein hisIE [Includes: Phosphoribosyl-AMP cyclohydrolase (PRA-CH); Phosphoribosyl-ATP pyrophosphatase (PRA-PH)] [Limnospira indica PCC 8005]
MVFFMKFSGVMAAGKPPELGNLIDIDKIRYDDQGLVAIAIQDILNGGVLALGSMNREALQKTLATQQLWWVQQSQIELWHPDIILESISYDYRGNFLVAGVAYCPSELNGSGGHTLAGLFRVICDRRDHPNSQSYTCQLFAGGDNKILKKIGEEAAEVVMACKDDEPQAIASEVADLFYHSLVALAYHQVDLRKVYEQLEARRQ